MDNLQEYLTNQVNAIRKAKFDSSDQLSLGEMIKKLTDIIDGLKDKVEEPTVYFDFGSLFPTCIDSWRGSYNELALDYTEDFNNSKPKTITEFLTILNDAIGKTFIGYKGGKYVMSKDTPVWVANYSHSGNTAVIDVLNEAYYRVIIITGYREF